MTTVSVLSISASVNDCGAVSDNSELADSSTGASVMATSPDSLGFPGCSSLSVTVSVSVGAGCSVTVSEVSPL